MRPCLCKECETVDITTMGDTAKYEAVLLCRCCNGVRLIRLNERRCPNYRGQ